MFLVGITNLPEEVLNVAVLELQDVLDRIHVCQLLVHEVISWPDLLQQLGLDLRLFLQPGAARYVSFQKGQFFS